MMMKSLGLSLLGLPALMGLLGQTGILERAVRANGTVFELARPVYWFSVSNYHKHVKDSGILSSYIRSTPVRKLQLGAGDYDAPGWLNSDYEPNPNQIFLDVTARFPLPNSSFSYIFSEHLIEHVPYESGQAMLKECYRVLAPGGKIRTVTPNLNQFTALFTDAGKSAEAQEFIREKERFHDWPATPVPATFILNREVRDWGHQFIYDPLTLKSSLEAAGFKNVRVFRPGQYGDPAFAEAEGRSKMPGSSLAVMNNWEAMAIEAER